MSKDHPEYEWGGDANENDDNAVPRLSTGIEVLDRKLNGGIPAGCVVALSAKPASQSELFLYEMAGVRETLYLTTERTVTDVEESLDVNATDPDRTIVREIDGPGGLDTARDHLEDLDDGATAIVDPIGPLEEADPSDYRTFINDLKARTVESGSVTVLHCLNRQQVPAQRDRTVYLADVIFDLATDHRGSTVENSLFVPKFRDGAARSEAIELDLTTSVTIDVSRKIA